MRTSSFISLFLAVIWLAGCASGNQENTDNTAPQSWNEITEAGKGESITMMMWQGDPLINQYMETYVVPEVKDRFNIDLNLVNGQGNAVVNTLMTELEAGASASEIDLMWINGETFFQLRQIKALHGPFVKQLPNSQYLNFDNPFIGIDFQQPVEGYECPWGNVQLALIYNETQVTDPPQTLEELEAWVQANPGKFTIPNEFTGMTLLKSWMIALAGGPGALDGPFDPDVYAENSAKLWEYVNGLKPYLWNEGESFPSSLAQVHQMFANGELYFTISNNDSEVDNKIGQGLFPETSSAYVPEYGTIQNSHYLGISSNSAHKEAAKLVINFMISPEAQFTKMQPSVWGDGTVLSIPTLPTEWQEKFKTIPGRDRAPNRAEIQDRALMEPAPEYMIRLFEGFRSQVMEN